VQQIPPHIKDFLEAELQSEATKLKAMSTLQDPYRHTSAKQNLTAETKVKIFLFFSNRISGFTFN